MRVAVLLTLLVSGFLVGCDPMATERVLLKVPTGAEGDEAAKRAVAVIDEVMKQQAFRPSTGTLTNAPYLASYYSGVGNLACFVYHNTGELEVRFGDFGRSRSRPEATKARDAVRQRLIEKFGKEKVSE
jgi:hypothetical protein